VGIAPAAGRRRIGVSEQGDRIRRPVAAGSFYPGSAASLADTVEDLLASARVEPLAAGEVVRGVVSPHAGYVYSGPIAASAYRFLRLAPAPARIVVLGPSHFEPLSGLAVTGADAWRTPLGDVAVDDAARAMLLRDGAISADAPHRSEHSIEVQLPFLQHSFPGVPVLPVAVGRGDPEVGARTIAATLAHDGLLVVSTDLSHYLDGDAARRVDRRTAAAVEALDLDRLRPDDACGFDALRVGLAWARGLGYDVRLLDLRSSADTAGDPHRVVGYGAFGIVGPGR
jgi:hypothetical protein